MDLGGGLGIAYVCRRRSRAAEAELGGQLSAIVGSECAAAGLPVPRLAVEPGRAIVGPGGITIYEVGTVKDVDVECGGHRRYVSVDGGMSDNIRTALYDAEYTCPLAIAASRRAGRGWRASSASTARAATSSCATPGCPATCAGDLLASPPPAPTAAAWPATTTTPAVRRWSRCATGSPGDPAPGDRSTTCCVWNVR